MNLRELFWPRLEEPTPVVSAQRAEQRRAELDIIKTATLGVDHIDVLIDEAQRLTDAENTRRTGTDARATTYLAIVGVFTPILVTLAPVAISGGLIRGFTTLVLFSAAGAYLAGYAFWSFRVLKVSTGARVDAVDLIKLWREADPRIQLAKDLLYSVRWNREEVNSKITCIKMAHEFGLRALAVFVAALVVRATWEPILAFVKVVGTTK